MVRAPNMPTSDRCGSCSLHLMLQAIPDEQGLDALHLCLLYHRKTFDPHEESNLAPCAFRIPGRPQWMDSIDQALVAQEPGSLMHFLLVQRAEIDRRFRRFMRQETDRAEARLDMIQGAFLGSGHQKLELASLIPDDMLQAALDSAEQEAAAEEARVKREEAKGYPGESPIRAAFQKALAVKHGRSTP